jgi:hypothetical protein
MCSNIDHECGSTSGSNCGTVTPCGLLRIHNLLPLGKWSQKEKKEKKREKTKRICTKEYQE